MIKSRFGFKFYKNFINRQSYASLPQRKRICIIGGGPSGFYTAEYLLKGKCNEVDIYEKLPVPFGLIRYGVAPDHTDIKNVTVKYTKTANNERCRYFGNVNVGKDVSISELLDAYHVVVLAYGAQNDKKLNIPGEDSKNVFSAREFVCWYNGHPDFMNLNINLDCETVLVIGQGNVALDVCRILLRNVDDLKETDISEQALEQLNKKRVKRVIMTGRRGPLQVAFTTKEFRQITKLHGFNILLHPEDFEGFTEEFLKSIHRSKMRMQQIMLNTLKKPPSTEDKTWEIKFYRNPKAIISNSQKKVEKILFGVNRLKELGITEDLEVIDTGKEEAVNCELVLKSVGYQSVQIDPSIPFDETKRIIPNVNGKVTGKKGLYCSGWVKTGPQGVLVPTFYTSQETGETIATDMERDDFKRNPSVDREDILNLLKNRGVKYVTFEDWKKIDKLEEERGKSKGKIRDKLYTIEDMLKAAMIS